MQRILSCATAALVLGMSISATDRVPAPASSPDTGSAPASALGSAPARAAAAEASRSAQEPTSSPDRETFPVPIVNPAFDEGVDDEGVPIGWQRYSGSPDATLSLAPDGGGLILDDQDADAEIGVMQTFPLTPTLAYEVSLMAHGFRSRSQTGAYLQLRFLPSQEYAQVSLSTGSVEELQRVALRAVAPDDTTDARIYLYTHRDPEPKVLVTDVSVTGGVEPPPPPPPEPVPPVYDLVKDLRSEIPLASDGEATCAIVAPDAHRQAADAIQEAIRALSGVDVPIVSDRSPDAATPLVTNVIVLGNRSTNRTSNELYDRHYSLMDLKYPGKNGYAVRSVHDPYGNGFGAILVGGSDSSGVTAGARAFIDSLHADPASPGELSAGWTILTRLGDGLTVPDDIRDFETWEASKNYGSIGYFGWNSISKRMAMYYMTGDPFHAREVIRLSFPDAQAISEIEEIDGERIENKQDPLAGPYHYNAMMLILYWDLIEESPVFTDEERLAVTNAFARRLDHPQDRSTYFITDTPAGVSTRHGQWSALSLYTLARYFTKYYPSSVWTQAKRAGELAFSSLDEHTWLSGENDNLFWYCTGLAPTVTYLVLSGHRTPIENGVLDSLLRGQEALISGRSPDWALNYAALDYFHKAAYLTGDGRWIEYRRRTALDTDVFRLGQSFWPGDDISRAEPVDLVNRWLVHQMSGPMWLARGAPFELDESFQWMSFRSAADASGDFVLIDGYNGASRNPYHTYVILELRLGGRTLLDGYMNQVLTSAAGMVEPLVPMDGQLLQHDVIGSTALAVGQVPGLSFTNWRRTLVQRTGKYALIVDDLTFRSDSSAMEVDTTWQFVGGRWDADKQAIRASVAGWAAHLPIGIVPGSRSAQARGTTNGKPGIAGSTVSDIGKVTLSYELHPSGVQVVTGRNPVHMSWAGETRDGDERHAFYLLGRDASHVPGELASLQVAANAAALGLPAPAVAAVGTFRGISGDLAVLADDHLFGRNVSRVGLDKELLVADAPLDVEWDFVAAELHVLASAPTRLTLTADGTSALVDGEPGRVTQTGETCVVDLAAGRHVLTGLAPNDPGLRDGLVALLADGRARREADLSATPTASPDVPDLPELGGTTVGAAVSHLEVLTGTDGPQIAVAAGTTIHVLEADGTELRRMAADAQILSLRWWPKHRLILAGCSDEKLIAFDETGARRWVFTSEMAPEVTEAGKTYWYKSAPGHEGVRGLFTGTFLNGEEQAFVGSACTLEIVDADGQLVERTPFFWGPGTVFQLVPQPDGSIDLLVGREPNGIAHLWAYNNVTREKRKTFYRVPAGHTFVSGWATMARDHIFVADVVGDEAPEVISEINGTWNRVTVWDLDGTPLHNAQFGAGAARPFRNMRDLDLVDLDGDGKPEIVVATAAGRVTALDGACSPLWSARFESPPTVLEALPADDDAPVTIVVGFEDGTILALDSDGALVSRGRLDGAPTHVTSVKTLEGTRVVVGTATGQVAILAP